MPHTLLRHVTHKEINVFLFISIAVCYTFLHLYYCVLSFLFVSSLKDLF